MSQFKPGDYVVPSSQIVIYDAKMKNYLGRVLQVATVHEQQYYGSVQAGIPGEEVWGWNPHDLRLATAEEIAAAQKLKPLRRGDLVEYDGRVCVVAEIDPEDGSCWVAALTGEHGYDRVPADELKRIGSVRKKVKRLKAAIAKAGGAV